MGHEWAGTNPTQLFAIHRNLLIILHFTTNSKHKTKNHDENKCYISTNYLFISWLYVIHLRISNENVTQNALWNGFESFQTHLHNDKNLAKHLRINGARAPRFCMNTPQPLWELSKIAFFVPVWISFL